METERLMVSEHHSENAKQGSLILSVTTILLARPRTVELVVGRIGLPSVIRTLNVGGAVLFETPDDGLFEIRIIGIYDPPGGNTAEFAITMLVPRHAPTAGVANENTANDPFTSSEVEHIRNSVEAVRDAVRQRDDVTPEQADYISRRLDEIVDAANRLGRRDWVNLAVGTLTNVVVGAAVGSNAAKFLFQSMGEALGWLLGETLKLLP